MKFLLVNLTAGIAGSSYSPLSKRRSSSLSPADSSNFPIEMLFWVTSMDGAGAVYERWATIGHSILTELMSTNELNEITRKLQIQPEFVEALHKLSFVTSPTSEIPSYFDRRSDARREWTHRVSSFLSLDIGQSDQNTTPPSSQSDLLVISSKSPTWLRRIFPLPWYLILPHSKSTVCRWLNSPQKHN
jgi:hypothetical protein